MNAERVSGRGHMSHVSAPLDFVLSHHSVESLRPSLLCVPLLHGVLILLRILLPSFTLYAKQGTATDSVT